MGSAASSVCETTELPLMVGGDPATGQLPPSPPSDPLPVSLSVSAAAGRGWAGEEGGGAAVVAMARGNEAGLQGGKCIG